MIEKIFMSKQFVIATWGVALLLVLVLTFYAGARFGFSRSFASCGYHESYRKNFEGFGQKPMQRKGGMFPDSFGAHGVFGQIVSVHGEDMIIRERDGVEKLIRVHASTTIMRQKEAVHLSSLATDEHVMVVGDVGGDGVVVAKFMRALPDVPPMWDNK
jgi:hypothetical protein